MAHDESVDRRESFAGLEVMGSATAPGDIPIGSDRSDIIMADQLRNIELAQNNAANSDPLAGILPNITALQKQSAELQNYFTVGRWCTPARAAKLTGLYSPQTCMYVTQGNDSAPNLLPTFASGGAVTGFPTFGSTSSPEQLVSAVTSFKPAMD